MKISPAVVSLLLTVGAWAAAPQNQQSAPPLNDQSAYPSATHKMTPAEKSNTPEAHGQPVDLFPGLDPIWRKISSWHAPSSPKKIC